VHVRNWNARKRIAVLAAVGGVSLAVGLPLLDLTGPTATEITDGSVVSVHGAHRTLTVHDVNGAAVLRGHDVTIQLTARQRIRLVSGSEPLEAVETGQHVRARIGANAQHPARWVMLYTAGGAP
jgi:hypothetical protein